MSDIKKMLAEQSPTIVDVREPFEVESGKAAGAINIPLGEVPHRIDEFRNMKTPVIVYCRSGNRSGQAMNFLRANGIDEVYNGGGINDMLSMQS